MIFDFDDEDDFDFEKIREKLNESQNDENTIQFEGNLFPNDEVFKKINTLCKENNANLELRFYNSLLHEDFFSCKILNKIPHVKNLSITLYSNYKTKAIDQEELYKLKHLEKLNLTLGPSTIDTNLLKHINHSLISNLYLGESNNKNMLDLSHLEKYRKLKSLIIQGHSKNIEIIKKLTYLDELYLDRISNKVTFEFINSLNALNVLSISFGSRENLNEITQLNVQKLFLYSIRGLNTIQNLLENRNLKILVVENQRKIEKVSFDKTLPKVKSIEFRNCTQLKEITNLNNLQNLEEISLSKTDISLESILNQELPKTLKKIWLYTGRKKLDNEVELKLKNLGY